MRFRKGIKVEVMNKDVPAAWSVAEIISGNGSAYTVRYDGYHGVEKVSRRFIRPSPPAIGSQNWILGDIVEVFDENSWKVATVSRILKGGRLLVRLHGFTHEIRTHKANVRARQSWIDGQWIPVGKVSGSNGAEKNCSLKMGTQVPLVGSKIRQKEDDCLSIYNDARLQKLKRSSPFCSYLPEAKKVKHAEKDVSQSQRHVSGPSFEKMIFLVMGSLIILRGLNTKLQQVFIEPRLEACISCFQRVQTGFGSAAFLLENAVGHFSIHLLQIRQPVAIWHLSERYIVLAH